MPRKKRDVEASLLKKGFKKVESDHSYFVYYTSEDLKSRVRTKTSHGAKNNDISDHWLSAMASQCRISNKQFRDLIECPLSREKYEALLLAQGIL